MSLSLYGITLLLLSSLFSSDADCEEERKRWNDWMVSEQASMFSYLSSPAVFYQTFYSETVGLAKCMNKYFKTKIDASEPVSAARRMWAKQYMATIPAKDNEHLYLAAPPLELHEKFLEYKAEVTGLLSPMGLAHDPEDLKIYSGLKPQRIAERRDASADYVCCLQDFAFMYVAPRATKINGKAMMATEHKTMYCRKNMAVFGFSTSAKFSEPHFAWGVYKLDSSEAATERVDESMMLDYEALNDEQNTFTFKANDEMNKYDVPKDGGLIEKSTVTNLTKEMFLAKLGDKVSPCASHPDFRHFSGVFAIEPGERGRFGRKADPIPIPDRSMMHKEADHHIRFARVTIPKAFLVAVRYVCASSYGALTMKMAEFKNCSRPLLYPLKEVTHVSGTGLRIFKTKWQSVNSKDMITFNKEMGTDYELIVLFSTLLALFLAFVTILRYKDSFLKSD